MTAAGIDNNHNGIRDEVDALISREYQESVAQTKYAQQLARAMQVSATIVKPSRDQATSILKTNMLGVACLRYNTSTDKGDADVSKLTAATFNTTGRRKNNEEVGLIAGIISISVPRSDACK
ncbi:hypothetical protein [Deinococcus sp.]|uniref:hypothetical protein n=1 Tax=Deinococcus sp. TaxID=47478 RepID=UPI003C7DE2D9